MSAGCVLKWVTCVGAGHVAFASEEFSTGVFLDRVTQRYATLSA
jgi:hypothetical protein